jgi:hypothetical protein
MKPADKIKETLSELGLECYANPVNTDDTLVFLARIKSATTNEFTDKETRLLRFIERALNKADDEYADDVKVRFSRLWLLKNKKLHYTWDFTFKGDIEVASKLMESIKITPLRETRVEQVETQVTKHKRGNVRSVSVMQ